MLRSLLIIFALLLSGTSLFSQEDVSYRKSFMSKFYIEGQTYTRPRDYNRELAIIYKKNNATEALKLFKDYKALNVVSIVVACIGSVGVGISANAFYGDILALTTPSTLTIALMGGGVALYGVAVGLSFVSQAKLFKSIDVYNRNIKGQETPMMSLNLELFLGDTSGLKIVGRF